MLDGDAHQLGQRVHAELSVSVIHAGKTETYEVAETVISPDWRTWNLERGAVGRLPYDLALIITKEPVGVGALEFHSGGNPSAPGQETIAIHDYAVPNVSVEQRPLQRGVLVAFGGERCSSSIQCEDAGVRRVLPVVMQGSSYCFKNRRRRRSDEPPAVWCMESSVMPGDNSGGASLVEADDGQPLMSARSRCSRACLPSLPPSLSWQRSLAAALFSNLHFIIGKGQGAGLRPPGYRDAAVGSDRSGVERAAAAAGGRYLRKAEGVKAIACGSCS